MAQRIKTVQESDLRMLGSLARNIQRVLPVTQADIDAAAALGKGWVVWKVFEVNDPIDNLRGGTQLVIKQNSIQPGQNVRRVLIVSGPGGETVVIGPGPSPLLLPDAVANSLQYVKAFGGTEQRNLPAGYTQVEYLESTGTQYIDTGIVLKSDATITMVAQADAVTSGGPYAFWGFMGSDTMPRWGWSIYSTAWLTDLNQTNTASTANTQKHTFVNSCFYTGTDLYYNSFVDGSPLFTNARAVTQVATYTGNTLSAYLFARNNNGTVGNFLSCKIFSFEVVQDGVKVLDLIPCRQNSNNVLGMYDTVSGQFFTNAGTGVFTAGADVVPSPDTPVDIVSNNGVLKARHQSGLPLGYTALESVNNDGTGWLDLGMPIGSADIITFDIEWNENVASPFFGAYEQNGSYSYLSFVGTYYNNPNSISFYANGPSPIGIVTKPTGRCLLKWNGVSAKPTLDGSELGSANPPYNNYTPNVNAYLFTRNQGGTAGSVDNITMYGFSVERNGVIISNLVPAKRNSDNVVGMYDTIRGLFLTSAGTGDFDAGNAVSDPVEIYTDGTVETIGVRGKNLIDESTLVKASATVWRYYSTTSQGGFNLKANTTYTLSTNNPNINVYFYDYETKTSIASGAHFKTYTPTEDVTVYFTLYLSAGIPDDTRIQLEIGNTATEYEPYFDGGTATAEMLLKVGDYQDEQEILSGAVTRNVGIKVLDGTEDWMYSIPLTRMFCNHDIQQPTPDRTVLCTHFRTQSTVPTVRDGYCVKSADGYVGIGYGALNGDVAAFKAFLAAQYANGTPVIVVYPLATPTTESVAGQELQVQAGDNVVEVTQASIDGLELEAQYTKGQ